MASGCGLCFIGCWSGVNRAYRIRRDCGARGVQFVSHSSPTDKKNQPETMVAGVAIFDYDGDGLPDIYLVNGAKMPSLVKEGEQYKIACFTTTAI